MVSLPPLILHEGKHRKFSNISQLGSVDSSKINNPFCDDCTKELGLPVCKISSHLLQQYRIECARLREAYFFNGDNKLTSSSDSLELKQKTIINVEKCPPVRISEFPLIDHSNLQYLDTYSDWKKKILNVKISRDTKRCHILHMKPKSKKHHIKYQSKQFPPLLTSQDVPVEGIHHFQTTLLASPQVVLFKNYEVGRVYKKHCKITNVSSKKCTFTVHSAHPHPQFKVEWCPGANILAAGMSVNLTVLFRCTSLVDTQEELLVTVRGGAELTVHLVASTLPPHLIELNNPASNVRTSLGNNEMISVIDCGSLFVGEHNTVLMNFKNVGLSSRFCFVGETDWYSMRLDLDASNRLIVASGLFTIEPMYFSLNKGQTIEVSVSCYGISIGFHTDQVFLLCNNTAIKRIDLESDCFLFDQSWIRFPGLSKMFDVDIEDIDCTENCIDFGISPIGSILYHSFELHHTGCINISYHWEMRTSNVTMTKPFPITTMKITPSGGRLLHKTQVVFYLQCDTASLQPGMYRMLLVLVVDDLKEKCIPLDLRKKLLQFDCESENKLRSIELSTIEVMLECTKPNVYIFPYEIDFSAPPLIIGSTETNTSVIVENRSSGTVNLTWLFKEENSIVELNIDPKKIEIEKFSAICCQVSANALQEGNFKTYFWCVFDNADFGLKLEIRGACSKGELIMMKNSIDFGNIKKESEHVNQIIAKSCYTNNTSWTLNEFTFDMTDNGQLIPSVALDSLSAIEGEFCHKDSEVLIRYQLSTQDDEIICSVLDFRGQYISVLADVQEADVSLNTHTVRPELLYQDVQYTTYIFVRNHTLHHTPVFWGNPTFSQGAVMTVNITPRFAVLEPAQELMAKVCLSPHVVGSLRNIFIPCFVEGLLQPLVLKVEGEVKGLKLRVEWKSHSKHCSVVWPPEGSEAEIYSPSLESFLCVCPTNSFDSLAIESGVESQVPVEPNSNAKVQNDNNDNEDVFSNADSEEVTTISSIPYFNWPIIGGRYTRDPMSEEMEKHFNNLFTSEDREVHRNLNESVNDHTDDNTLCFHDIPTGQALSQLVYIRNDTMISSYYEACVKVNFERSPSFEKSSLPERIQRKVQFRLDKDDFSERASKDRGLTVFLEPAQGQILPEDYVVLRVTVYANSWGSYSDVVILQLGELEQFCLRLHVTVNQQPVTAPSRVSFGAVFYKAVEEYRLLQLENRSTLPLVICWHMFSRETDLLPFSLMLVDGSPFELHLTPFYGSCGSRIFKLEENYTYMEPCSSLKVKIKLNPQGCNISIIDKEFSKVKKAVLVGHVYLTDEANSITNAESCVRENLKNLLTLQVELEAHLQIPLLSLLNVFNYQLVFKCTAYDVMSTKRKIWQEEKVIRVQNNCHIHYKGKITTVGYFHVSKITYPCDDKKHVTLKNEISLNPGETCEVTICCVVTQETLYECFEEGPLIPPNSYIEAGTVERGLINFEQEDLIQKVLLELYLYQPLLGLSSTSLNFGLVFVGDTKTLSLALTAPISKESFQTFIKSGNHDEVFSVNVGSGTLDPKMIFPLQISFSPKVNVAYKDVLTVRACLDQMSWEVPIFGVGTFNYKSHVY